MKHLLIFVENYVAGGADKMARIYADNLGAEKVSILYNCNDDTSVLFQEPLSPHIAPLPYSFPTIANLGAYANRFKNMLPLFAFLKLLNLIIRYPLWLFALIYFFFKILSIKPTHIIINNGGYPGGEWCRVATISAKIYTLFSKLSIPIIHIVHNHATKPFFFFLAPIEYLIDFLIDKSSKIICVSYENAKILKKTRYIKQNIEVIHNGVQINECKKHFPPSTHPLKILNVASLDSRKNQLLILQSLAKLGLDCIELHLVGKEEELGYLDMLKQYAKDCNLKVFFHGFCLPERFYQECDIFILSSIVEGFPLVTLEAMSYSMPIITTKCGGSIEQIIDNYNGLIVETNAASMSEAIDFFITNPQEIEKMGKNAYHHVKKHFAFAKMVDKYIFWLNQ